MEEDNKELVSAVRDTLAYVIAEDIIDSLNPHNPKQDLVQVLANINYQCQDKIEGFVSILTFSMNTQNLLAGIAGVELLYTEEEMADIPKEFYNNMMSQLSLAVINTGISTGIDEHKSIFAKAIDWIKKLFKR